MKNKAKIKGIERDIEQLRRALTNQNLAAAHLGSPENIAALERLQQKEKEIDDLSNEP